MITLLRIAIILIALTIIVGPTLISLSRGTFHRRSRLVQAMALVAMGILFTFTLTRSH